MRKRLPIVLVSLLLVAAILYFAVGYVVYTRLGSVQHSCDPHMANTPNHFTNISKWPEFDIEKYYMPSYEVVQFPSRFRSMLLTGWYVAGDPNQPAVILVDGLGGCKNAQAILVPAGMLHNNGFSVLLLDLHDTGDSATDDGYSTIGTDEYMDVEGAWDWLVQQKGFAAEQVGVVGNSLSGAATLYAMVDEPRIAALFLNSPIANLPVIIREELHRVGYPTWLAPGGIIMARLLTGENIVEKSPLAAIQQVGKRPIFVVHSFDDKRVPVHHSQELQAAAEAAGVNAEFWFISGADHMRAPAVYPQEFEEKIVGFFQRTLAGKP